MAPPFGSALFKRIDNPHAMSCYFQDPQFPTSHVFLAKLLKEGLMFVLGVSYNLNHPSTFTIADLSRPASPFSQSNNYTNLNKTYSRKAYPLLRFSFLRIAFNNIAELFRKGISPLQGYLHFSLFHFHLIASIRVILPKG